MPRLCPATGAFVNAAGRNSSPPALKQDRAGRRVRAHLRDLAWQLSISGVTLHRIDHQPVALDPVDKTVLVAETHRPEPGQVPTQRFWLVQPRERFLDQISDDFDDAVQEPRPLLRQEHELPARLPGEVRSQDRR